MKLGKRLSALVLVVAFLVSCMPVLADSDEHATRQYVISEFVQSVGRNSFTELADLSGFKDSGAISDEYVSDMQMAVGSGLINGYEDNTIRPADKILRVEALVILSRCLPELEPVTEKLVFEDTPDWAQQDIDRLTQAGIVKGYGDGTFGCNDYLTKEQVGLLTGRVDFIMNPVEAADDFYQYINGKTIRNHTPYPGAIGWSYFDEINHDNTEIIKQEVLNIAANRGQYQANSIEGRIADTYLLASDYDKRNADGLKPIRQILDRIMQSTSLTEYIDIEAQVMMITGMPGIMQFTVDPDLKDSNTRRLYFYGCDIGLNKETWQAEEAEFVREAYQTYIQTLLEIGGYDNAADYAAQICAMQKDLASYDYTYQQSNDISVIYNLYSMPQFQTLMTNITVYQVFNILGIEQGTNVLVPNPELCKRLNSYLTRDNLELLKMYSVYSLLDSFVPFLSTDLMEASRNFTRATSSITEFDSDEDMANYITQSLWGMELGKHYVDQHFSAQAKEDVTSMVEEIREVFYSRIQQADWMSEQTKANAIKKLQNISLKIGYPDSWEFLEFDYAITPAAEGGSLAWVIMDLMGSSMAGQFYLLPEPVNKELWQTVPQAVNAFYDPTANEMIIPAGILQAPFYDVNASRAANLGAIGVIIAHEMTHAFDNSGAQFDEKGNAADWWTQEDKANFDKLTQAVVDYFDQQEILPGLYVDGELTVGENIADLGGVACALQIVKDNNLDLQEFFESYARMWALNQSDEYALSQSLTDPHAPQKIRVNGILPNFGEFYEAYDITEEDDMYVKPEDRVQIW